MEGLNGNAQWIILLGFIISISIFFLALIVNESVLVGQTTAESVLDLPKSDIHDLRSEVFRSAEINSTSHGWEQDLINLSIARKNAIVTMQVPPAWPPNPYDTVFIHFNNGVTDYYETFYY